MELELKKKPKNVTIIEGFPGFGLVGVIATEYLLQHLDCELIGTFWFEKQQAVIAIHESKVVHPIGIYYDKKYNLVILHAIMGHTGVEWEAAEMISNMAKQMEAKEIICLEGVSTSTPSDKPRSFYYSSDEEKKKFLNEFSEPLKEGIIVGVTAALMVKDKIPVTCFFADTHSQLPDSNAAAKIVEMLDKYLNLTIDPKPLKETAKMFEDKLKEIMKQTTFTQEEKEKKELSYVG